MTCATSTVSVNSPQALFVIPSGSGYSCLGFDVCERRRERYAHALGVKLDPQPRGSLDQYASYHELLVRVCSLPARCDADLCPQLIGLEGKRVEVVTHYGETRRFWVGKSTGVLPIHLEISRRNSMSGSAASETGYKSVRVVS